MKKLFPLTVFVLLLGCNNDKNSDVSGELKRYDTIYIGPKIFRFAEIKEADFRFPEKSYAAKESEALDANPSITRKGDSLLIKCNGKMVHLVDNVSEEDDYVKFELMGFDEESDHYVIHCSLYEGQGYVIVNKTTGSMLETCSIPYVSPDKKFLVCGNADLVAGFDFNGIQIFEKDMNGYRPAGSRELSGWGPTNMMWKNDSVLIVKGQKLNADGISVSDFLTEWIVK